MKFTYFEGLLLHSPVDPESKTNGMHVSCGASFTFPWIGN